MFHSLSSLSVFPAATTQDLNISTVLVLDMCQSHIKNLLHIL